MRSRLTKRACHRTRNLRIDSDEKGFVETTMWTIGHGRRTKDEFLKVLKSHGIQTLVDVRRFPTSKTEHFKLDAMRTWLRKEDISYIWLGDELGGYRREGYEKHMRSKLFTEGVRKLLKLAREGNTCIMCLEVNPKYCHRRFISDYIKRDGVKVVHII